VSAWCLYDFANSSYTTLIVTVVFAVYFREVVVAANDNSGDQLWGLANFVAMLIVALTSPVLGAIADESGRRRFLLIATTLLTVLATALLYFATPGKIFLAMALYVIATIGFEIGYVFYNSFLPEVSTPETIGRVSGWGWGIGFAGGLAALMLCSPWIASELREAGGRLSESAIHDRRISFLLVAAFYLVFALPAFAWLRGSRSPERAPSLAGYVRMGFGRVAVTLRHLRSHVEVAKFIAASVFYTDGITTVIVFSATYATVTFGFSSEELIRLFVVMNVIAFPATVGAGYLADAIGARRTLVLSLLLWIVVILGGFWAASKAHFWLMGAGVAVGMGASQAVGRSYMAEISPRERSAEFFGFYVMSGKMASVSGPLLFGTISAWTGSQRIAVLSLIPLFAIALVLLLSVNDAAARRATQGGKA